MNDYDNNYGSENANGKAEETAAPENGAENKENASVQDASPGTKADSTENTSGSNGAASNGYTSYSDVGGAQNNSQNNGYPYGAQNNAQNNGYPYGAQNNAQNNTQNNGYPYGAQSGGAYNGDYSQQGNPYPYSNGANRNGGYAYPPQDGGSRKSSKKGKTVFIVIVALLFVGAVAGLISTFFGDGPSTSGEDTTNKGIENVDELSSASTPVKTDTDVSEGSILSASSVFAKVKNSSVGILVYNGSSLSSEGSGVIFTEDTDGKYTYIITCAHVISDSGVSVMVQLADEKEYKAEVVGYDTVTDIGVLRIEASGLQKAEIGDSSALVVGETVYAIGNPGGVEFANSFTNGMVSAIDRPVSSSATGYTMECIQHTAAINPGNSGGALVNEYGQVIGINSMKIVSDEYEGMGFAVPSSVFVKVVNEIIANGYVTNRPKLGITYIPASSQQTYAMYAAIKGLPSGTIIIYSISDDSSFKGTDAQKGDMIIAVNGEPLETTSTLSEIVEKSNVGDKLTLTLVRLDVQNNYSAKEFDVTVTLVENRGNTYASSDEETTSQSSDIFGGSGGSDSSDAYDYFKDYFDRYFGGNGGR